jgi:hypothetical protein
MSWCRNIIIIVYIFTTGHIMSYNVIAVYHHFEHFAAISWLIDWCLTPTLAVFQLYRDYKINRGVNPCQLYGYFPAPSEHYASGYLRWVSDANPLGQSCWCRKSTIFTSLARWSVRNIKTGNSISTDFLEDTIKNDENDSCFCSF